MRVGIFTKTASLSWLITLFTMGLFVLVMIPWQKNMLMESLNSKGRGISASMHELTASAAITEDFSSVVDYCMQLLNRDPSIKYIVLTRDDGFSLSSTRSHWSIEQTDVAQLPVSRSPTGTIRESERVDEPVFEYAHPFDYSGIEWGWIQIGLSLDTYTTNLHAIYTRTALISAVCLLASFISSLIYARKLTAPIIQLKNTAQEIATGNLGIRANICTKDELEKLADTFNYMTASIQTREQNLRTQNRQLELLATNKTLHSGNILAAAQLIVETIAKTAKVRRASIWFINKEATGLACCDLFDAATGTHSQEGFIPLAGNELYFNAIRELRVLAINNVLTEPLVASLLDSYLRPNNIFATMDVPFQLGGQVSGVVCLEHLDVPRIWTLEEENFAGATANLIALSLEARDRKKTQDELLAAKDAAEAANQAKSQFLANMSHEIRTPLNGAIGMLNLLSRSSLDSRQQRLVSKGTLAAEALLLVINDILDFSKIEAGKMEVDAHPFNVTQVIENAVQIFAYRAEEKSLEIGCLIDPNIPDTVIGDSGRIGQVLNNLISNAVKFTTSGNVTVRARVVNEQTDSIQVEFRVEDSGLGMDPAEQRAVFHAFQQADSSTTRHFGGTGLGLAICHQLVSLMGGEIWVDSRPGKGSTFYFTAHFIKQPGRAHLPRNLKNIACQKVLIVDDHPTTREILSQWLTWWGLKPVQAENGAVALELIRAHQKAGAPFELAIVDWSMPEMDGEELGHHIQADEHLAPLPLILLSSVKDSADQPGHPVFAAELAKPPRQSELYDAIITAINNEPAPMTVQPPKVESLPQLPAGLTVLLAEDNQINQDLTKEILRASNCCCTIANNGREALELVARRDFNIILMDCMMPEMDGYEAARQIREKEKPGTRRIPIIALTANAMRDERDRCLNAGMTDYLTKPLNPALLIKLIQKWTETAAVAEPARPCSPSPSSTDPEQSLFDETVLLTRCMGNQVLMNKLLRNFIPQLEEDLDTLHAASVAGEAPDLITSAHRIKGAAANLTMQRLSAAAAAVETLGRNGRLDEAAREMGTLFSEKEIILTHLNEYSMAFKQPEGRDDN